MSVQENRILAHKNALIKAEQSIANVKNDVAQDPLRLNYHFMPPAYWVNDPNGFIQFKGDYHLFYQYNPHEAVWGPMHWGHAKSKDLVHWEHLPIALAPSESYELDDRGGCFSGSAVDDNGVLSLLYTGTVIKEGKLIQTQCLATSDDGITFIKYEGNPVIPNPPEEGSADFRDPKVWKHEEYWYMVLGSSKDGKGKALLYRSPDLRQWDYIGVLAESDGTMGTMWECPDFFPLDDRYVLMFSPMGMGDRKTVYLVGNMDYESGKFIWDVCGEIDHGFEYYAPQSLLDDKGRRIIIAWLNAWDWMPWFKNFGPTFNNNWCGAMSGPRTIELDEDGHLKFMPVEELKSLRGEHYHLDSTIINKETDHFPKSIKGDCIEIKAEFKLKDCHAEEFGFKLRVSASGDEETVLSYLLGTGELQFNRNSSDGWSEGIRKCKLESTGQDTLKLHIYVDTCVVEVFTDEGRTAMSNNIYPSPDSVNLKIFSNGAEVELVSLDIWQLRSAW
jgi:beta-fructofuranosidase